MAQNKAEVVRVLMEKIKDRNSVVKLADQILKGAETRLELEDSLDSWLCRFKRRLTWLSRNDYVRALIRALWLAPVFAGTDFGGSRQRDMAQVWTDTARGFLGEIALSKFLMSSFGVEIQLDTSRGKLEKYLPTDIAKIRRYGEEWRKPNLKVSIKTTKFNGRWLDIPGAQVEHSDIFILIKIGILRKHFLAFLKAISFLRDKLFAEAKSLGELSEEDSKQLWDEIPEFESLPAYIAGFLDKSELNLPIHVVKARKKGRKYKRIAVTQGIGLFSPRTLRNDEKIRSLDPEGKLTIEIEPIINSLTNTHFLAHSGGLKYREKSWLELVEKLQGKGKNEQK